ncbi:Protein tssc1 [Coemansia sp. RSA 552]|nr:Protein tssc1 [Coemansia sp. RSA 552]
MEAGGEASHVYGIERHTLCLAAVAGDPDNNRFVLGTLGITEPSEIHLVAFDSDEDALQSLVFRHSVGVRALASTPWNPAQLLIVGNSTSPQSPTVELAELPDVPPGALLGREGAEQPTRSIATLASNSEESLPVLPHAVVCHPAAHHKEAATVSSACVRVWDFGSSGPSVTHTISASRHSIPDDIDAAAWHPTDSSQLATSDGMCVRAWDTRVDTPRGQQTVAIEYAHNGRVRSLDHNPNMPHILASGGDDGSVRIWDLRNPSASLLEIANHTHWVYSLAFNPSHDQLLLSAGADGLVNLESTFSVSLAHAVAELQDASGKQDHERKNGLDEENLVSSDNEDFGSSQTDGLVARFDDHETSVYSAQWSAKDPWVFASLSFDGRVVINSVPQEERFKILL